MMQALVISSHCHVATAKCVLTELQVALQGTLMSNGNHVEPDDSIAHLLQGPNAEWCRTRQMPMKEETVEKTEDTTEKKTDEKTKVLVLTEPRRNNLEENALQFGLDEAIRQGYAKPRLPSLDEATRQRFTKTSLPSTPKPKVKFVPTFRRSRSRKTHKMPAPLVTPD